MQMAQSTLKLAEAWSLRVLAVKLCLSEACEAVKLREGKLLEL